MITWPSRLITDIARRRVVLVLGAGISRNCANANGVRPALWLDLLERAAELVPRSGAYKESIRRLLRDGDFLTACEVIKSALAEHDYHNFMRDEFVSPGFQHAEIHDTLIRIDSRIVATPNIDKIFDNRINAVQHNSVLIKNYYDADVAEAVRGTGRMVLKIHGTVDTPHRMIFTRTDYARARHEHRGFYSILDALAVTHTFLFLGCGLSDPDTRLLLEDYAFMHEYTAPHYFVIPNNAISTHVRPSLARSLNVNFLLYDPKDGHRILGDSLKTLADAVEAKRASLTLAEW